jgi:hypothetical protein
VREAGGDTAVRDEIVRASMMKAQLMLHVLPPCRGTLPLTAETLRWLTDEFSRAGDDIALWS